MGKWRDRFEVERDRRYTDLRAADQRALQIKETADATALTLAAALQAEKDERRNDILERWNDDRSTFLSRLEYKTSHDAVLEKIELLTGTRRGGLQTAWGVALALISLSVSILVAIILIVKG